MDATHEIQNTALRVGVDLVEIRRVSALAERYGERFTRRVFTPAELTECGGRPESLAARWAAKEAAAKALGTGFSAVGFNEIEVLRECTGRPELRMHGRARALAEERGLRSWAISISHDGGYALAFVVAT